jgi:hypothetical protein
MSVSLSFDEIIENGKPQLAHLVEVGDAYVSSDSPGARMAFSREVRLLESFLVHTYSLAVLVAKRADSLAEVANVWKQMEGFCTTAIHNLQKLKDKYPFCGTPELFDVILDYKLACAKRYGGVLEEIECQKQNPPQGLLPE